MKFTILSHAGLLVESNGVRIAVDPWILGSCYWRSWWNYPPAPEWARSMDVDFVYLTHLHWDHFHGPSLRKLPREAKLLVPEGHFTRLIDDGKVFKFAEIIELPHGKSMTLPGGLEIVSYQFGLMLDSALAISDGRTTLLDLNDCKLRGKPFEQVLARHPRVDFVFRSHSSASAYPWCVETDDPSALQYRSNEDYVSDFALTAQRVGARHAVPFASAFCFLHKDTVRLNPTVISPQDVKDYFERHVPAGDTECVVMVAGDSWSDESGFEIADDDWYSDRPARIAEYAAEKRDVLERQYALEARTRVEFSAFQRYFSAQVASIPRLSRWLFKPVVVFEVPEQPEVHWVVDYGRRVVEERVERPEDWALCLTIPAYVLKDCLYKRLFSTFSASNRLRIELRSGRIRDFMIFFTLLDMHEYEYFPLRRMLSFRFARVWARRWRELWMYASILFALVFRRGEDPLAKFMPKIATDSDSG